MFDNKNLESGSQNSGGGFQGLGFIIINLICYPKNLGKIQNHRGMLEVNWICRRKECVNF